MPGELLSAGLFHRDELGMYVGDLFSTLTRSLNKSEACQHGVVESL